MGKAEQAAARQKRTRIVKIRAALDFGNLQQRGGIVTFGRISMDLCRSLGCSASARDAQRLPDGYLSVAGGGRGPSSGGGLGRETSYGVLPQRNPIQGVQCFKSIGDPVPGDGGGSYSDSESNGCCFTSTRLLVPAQPAIQTAKNPSAKKNAINLFIFLSLSFLSELCQD